MLLWIKKQMLGESIKQLSDSMNMSLLAALGGQVYSGQQRPRYISGGLYLPYF